MERKTLKRNQPKADGKPHSQVLPWGLGSGGTLRPGPGLLWVMYSSPISLGPRKAWPQGACGFSEPLPRRQSPDVGGAVAHAWPAWLQILGMLPPGPSPPHQLPCASPSPLAHPAFSRAHR